MAEAERGAVPPARRSWLEDLPGVVRSRLDCSELALTPTEHAEAQRARLATDLQAVVAAYRPMGRSVGGGVQLCSRLRAKSLSSHDRERIEAAEQEAGLLFVAYEPPGDLTASDSP